MGFCSGQNPNPRSKSLRVCVRNQKRYSCPQSREILQTFAGGGGTKLKKEKTDRKVKSALTPAKNLLHDSQLYVCNAYNSLNWNEEDQAWYNYTAFDKNAKLWLDLNFL